MPMKYILVFLFLTPIAAVAQNCNLKTARDPYTKEIKVSTGMVELNSGQYSIEATKTGIDFMFSLESKCFDDASTATAFFEGTRLKTNFRNSGTMNCDGLFHISFRNTNPVQSALQNLGSKKVGSIRFKDNSGKETGISLTAEQQQAFMDFINCIISESQKLLQ
jgi:hypothetical protein